METTFTNHSNSTNQHSMKNAETNGFSVDAALEDTKNKVVDVRDSISGGFKNMKEGAVDAVDRSTTSVSKGFSSAASMVRDVNPTESIAARLESVESYLKESDGRSLSRDVIALAKRHPYITLAAGATFGYVIGSWISRR